MFWAKISINFFLNNFDRKLKVKDQIMGAKFKPCGELLACVEVSCHLERMYWDRVCICVPP